MSWLRGLINAFWGTVAAYITICGFGLALFGGVMLDSAGDLYAPIVGALTIVGGLIIGFIGYAFEKRVKAAEAGQRTYDHQAGV